MFSDAINSISWRCRPSSPLMAAAISGSAWSSVAVKNESGAEAVFAEEEVGGFICEYLHRRKLLKGWRAVMCGGGKRRGWGRSDRCGSSKVCGGTLLIF